MIIKVAHYHGLSIPLDVIVDDDFYQTKLSWYPWHIQRNGYVATFLYHEGKPSKVILLHRMIMKDVPHSPEFTQVDHINRNKRDNRRVNLRWVTRQENLINRG